MKNHFYYAYGGNKRTEVKEIYNNMNFDGIATIIEPYCGSSAICYYIWLNNKDKNYKYVLNDNNNYLKEMFELMQDDEKIKKFEDDYHKIIKDINKKHYDELIKNKDKKLMYDFLKYKIYSIRPGLFPIKEFTKGQKTINLKGYPIYDFYKNANIEFTNIDGIDCLNKYKDDEKNIIVMDPPYIDTCNDFYLNQSMNIYEYLYYNKINNMKAKIYLILEQMWIINLLFHENNKISYVKNYYGLKKKTSTHLIIKNH
jgi:hypothetical protein